MFGFGGTSFSGSSGGGGLKTAGKVGTVVVKPGRSGIQDNSKGGTIVGGGETSSVASGGGHRLGGSSTPGGGAGGGSDMDKVRQRWAGKSSAGSVSTGGTKVNTDGRKSESAPGGDEVDCPGCHKKIPLAMVNDHLDTCLANDQEDKTENDDVFDDDLDDDLLIAATQVAEKSVLAISDSDDDTLLVNMEHQHVISDSDDDEPLIKRRPPNTGIVVQDSDEDMFRDQDDRDILAALENVDKDDVNSSRFACPVCSSLVLHSEMNIHLDRCLS